MCACSNSPPKASTGDARATKTARSPPAKAASLPIVYLRGNSARRRSQPRRYSAATASSRHTNFKSNVHDASTAATTGSIYLPERLTSTFLSSGSAEADFAGCVESFAAGS